MSERIAEQPMETEHPPFDARTVLAQFYSGQIPASWHIYHARRRSLVSMGVVFLFGALIFALLAIVTASVGASDGSIMVPMIGAAAAATLGAAYMFIEARGIREQAVIITDDGFLVRTDVTIPAERIIVPRSFSVAFADLRNLTWTTQGWPRGLVDTMREAVSSRATMKAVLLDYLDGRHIELRFPARFGWPQPIIKDVLAAYESWQARQIAIE